MKIGPKMIILSLTLAILPMCLVLIVTLTALERIEDDISVVAVDNLTEEIMERLREVAIHHSENVKGRFQPFQDKALAMAEGRETLMDRGMRKTFRTAGDSIPTDWKPYINIFYVQVSRDDSESGGKMRVFAMQSFEKGKARVSPAPGHPLVPGDAAGAPRIISTLHSGRSGVSRMQKDEGNSMWAYSPLDDQGNFGVVLIMQKNPAIMGMEEAVTVIHEVGERVLVSCSFILVMVLLVVIFVAITSSMKLVGPIHRLVKCANRLSEGDYDAKVQIDTRDELHELGETFNNMGPRLHEHEQNKHALALASMIQNHMLPGSSRAVKGVKIYGKTHYCDETGGDYYDIVELRDGGDGSLAVAVGDVTGHGIGSALVMASVRGGLRALMRSSGDHPGQVLTSLNKLLLMDQGMHRYMTLCYLLIQPDRKVRYASAGHDPVLWLHAATGEVEAMENTGILLGAVPRDSYGEQDITLEEGDILVLYTDGILEAPNDEEHRFGKERLLEVIRSCVSKPAEEIEEEILKAVTEFRGGVPQHDDITVVLIQAVD